MQLLSVAIVAATGVFLVALGLAALIRPPLVCGFLLGFAGSAAKHYAELAVRLLVGIALVWAAPALAGSAVFWWFGWVLLGTTGVLVAVPWRLHRQFAQASVPQALRFLPVIGLASLAAGTATLWAVVAAGAMGLGR